MKTPENLNPLLVGLVALVAVFLMGYFLESSVTQKTIEKQLLCSQAGRRLHLAREKENDRKATVRRQGFVSELVNPIFEYFPESNECLYWGGLITTNTKRYWIIDVGTNKTIVEWAATNEGVDFEGSKEEFLQATTKIFPDQVSKIQ